MSTMEDLSGLEDIGNSDLPIEELESRLENLLKEVGETYTPVMLQNEEAINSGKTKVETFVRGKPWTQEIFPYQAKCLNWLRIEFSKLELSERQRISEMFSGTGCDLLIKKHQEE